MFKLDIPCRQHSKIYGLPLSTTSVKTVNSMVFSISSVKNKKIEY